MERQVGRAGNGGGAKGWEFAFPSGKTRSATHVDVRECLAAKRGFGERGRRKN